MRIWSHVPIQYTSSAAHSDFQGLIQLTHEEVTCTQTQAKFLEIVLSQICVPVLLYVDACCDTNVI